MRAQDGCIDWFWQVIGKRKIPQRIKALRDID